jgi:hypothetical protein
VSVKRSPEGKETQMVRTRNSSSRVFAIGVAWLSLGSLPILAVPSSQHIFELSSDSFAGEIPNASQLGIYHPKDGTAPTNGQSRFRADVFSVAAGWPSPPSAFANILMRDRLQNASAACISLRRGTNNVCTTGKVLLLNPSIRVQNSPATLANDGLLALSRSMGADVTCL